MFKLYGAQGWWPLSSIQNNYHSADYNYPKNNQQIFEICVGAILTQNTNWHNVEKAIQNLKIQNLLGPKKILKSNKKIILEMIKPSGYFNQKYKKLIYFSDEYLSWKGNIPSRSILLDIWGIGPETADSILLYAYKKRHFVIDSYTKKIFSNLQIIDKKKSYDDVQKYFEYNLPRDINIYQEYHALIVAHAKCYYSRFVAGKSCPLQSI